MATESYEDFNKFFRLVPADTIELKEQSFRLRYQVYCLETGFERREDFPDGMEKDEYDSSSDHYLIQHTKTGSFAATTRLILPDTQNLESPFPMERFTIIERTDILQAIPRLNLSEASRFCVSKNFKRRAGEAGTLAGIPTLPETRPNEEERRTFPILTIALFTALVRMSRAHNITHWVAVAEPALLRFLSSLGINFIPIGPVTNYHGMRQPCIIEIQHMLDNVRQKKPSAWNLLTDYGLHSHSSADRLFCSGAPTAQEQPHKPSLITNTES